MWLAWENHRRTIELCKFFGIKQTIFTSSLPRIIKHPLLIVKSWHIIHSRRPKILFVQNPSIFLSFLSCLLRKIYKYTLIVDSHNGGLVPPSTIIKRFQFIYEYIQREADITIVTNNNLADLVRENKGNPFVLPDKMPLPPKLNNKKLIGKYNTVYICTFESDEPYLEIIEAGKYLPDGTVIYITGNKNKISKEVIESAADNIIFTGFLADADYWNLLYSADLVIDLTYREDCLVCGAYEAVAVETPLLLSDTKTLKKYFYKGAIYTSNKTNDIVNNIKISMERNDKLSSEILELKSELIEQWLVSGNELKKKLEESLTVTE